MYANRFELRENKVRAKKEFHFEGYEWRIFSVLHAGNKGDGSGLKTN